MGAPNLMGGLVMSLNRSAAFRAARMAHMSKAFSERVSEAVADIDEITPDSGSGSAPSV